MPRLRTLDSSPKTLTLYWVAVPGQPQPAGVFSTFLSARNVARALREERGVAATVWLYTLDQQPGYQVFPLAA